MAKIRGFKPDLWTDEDFVEASFAARLLWLGMWNFACDNGHLADKSKQIKMRVLPTDDVNCAELLRELEGQGLIERADGWITVPNLTRHQKPDRRYFTTCQKEGCEAPPETVAQRESRRATPVQSRAHAIARVDGDGEVKGSDGDKPAVAPRPDVESLCSLLADLIEANGSKRPAITNTWRTAARLLIDADKRDTTEAARVMRWCQASDFWRPNVMSLQKFREKYDTLRLQSERDAPKSDAPRDQWARATVVGERPRTHQPVYPND